MSINLNHETLGAGAFRPGAPPPSPARPPGKLARTLRGTAMVLSSTFVVGAIVVVAEHVAPIDWRPSTMIGAFGGRQESARILASLDSARAMVAMQKEEEARAAQEVEALRANNERISQAYGQLFQRGTMLANHWAEGAKQTLLLNSQAKIEALKGRAEASSMKDTFGMLCDGLDILLMMGEGQATGCGDMLRKSARNDRVTMQTEIVEDYKAQSVNIATSLRDWAQGLPDPAEMVAAQNKIGQATPEQRAPVPPAPLPTFPQPAS